jgi:hypothetical protein
MKSPEREGRTHKGEVERFAGTTPLLRANLSSVEGTRVLGCEAAHGAMSSRIAADGVPPGGIMELVAPDSEAGPIRSLCEGAGGPSHPPFGATSGKVLLPCGGE